MAVTLLPLCVRVDAADARSADALRQDGWREIELLETWERRLPWFTFAGRRSPHVRAATADDMRICVQIARIAFHHDRLHVDRAVLREVADEVKAEWVRAAFSGDREINVCDDGLVKGFVITYRRDQARIIDLIAVDPAYQATGIGKALVYAAMWDDGKIMRASTQSSNDAGRALYRSMGFSVAKAQRTFHK